MSRITRRRLLENSLLAAAAAAVGGRAVSAKVRSVATRRIGPNDKIRIAVIGFRGRGGAHIDAYAGMDDVEIAMLCDPDKAVWPKGLAPIAKAGKPEPKCVQDLRRVFDDKSIDAVSIATPNHWHALSAIWAMQAGKDVYVEKPASHNVSEGRRMVEAARKYQRICQQGSQCRSTAGIREAIAYLHAGKIGKISVARGLCYKRRDSIGLCGGPQPVPETLDYDLWSGPAPVKPPHRNTKNGPVHYDWHWVWDYGNGDLGNQGIHQMDLARWGLNKNTLPNAALGLGGRFGYQDDGETPNTEICFLDYGDSQLIFEVRGLPKDAKYRGAGVGVVFHGTEGYLVLTSYTGGAAFDKDGKPVRKFSGGGDHFRNFFGAMRSRKHTDLNADIEDGHLSSALCHLGNISFCLGADVPFNTDSKALGDNKAAVETFERMQAHLKANDVPLDGAKYRLGKKLLIDPKTETFKDNPQANAMLTRPYRAPFVVPEKV